jgi:hypothetical protein
LSGAIDGVVGVAANLDKSHAKFQLESHLEAHADALSELYYLFINMYKSPFTFYLRNCVKVIFVTGRAGFLVPFSYQRS